MIWLIWKSFICYGFLTEVLKVWGEWFEMSSGLGFEKIFLKLVKREVVVRRIEEIVDFINIKLSYYDSFSLSGTDVFI